jgi:hypothetical protein
MMRLVVFALAGAVVTSPAAAHDARAAAVFTFTASEQALPAGPAGPGAVVTSLAANLEYGDGHRESVASHCEAQDIPGGPEFTRSGVCHAPGAYTMVFHCQAAGEAGSNCWGYLTGELSGQHNGRTGLITYRVGPEGVVGVGRWND